MKQMLFISGGVASKEASIMICKEHHAASATKPMRNIFCSCKKLNDTTHPKPASKSARPFVDMDLVEALAARGMALLMAADANMVDVCRLATGRSLLKEGLC